MLKSEESFEVLVMLYLPLETKSSYFKSLLFSRYLFNDAEVKPFDSAQLASECFGGEMTVSYDLSFLSRSTIAISVLKTSVNHSVAFTLALPSVVNIYRAVRRVSWVLINLRRCCADETLCSHR